jgi:serine protease Do
MAVFSNKTELDAELVGTDKPSDIALIKVKGANLPHIAFGDSSKMRLGEFVLAIGNPFGVGQTLTMGIVSAKGRANIGIVEYEDFIQTDAAINPGNSGGALVNMKGELVGINTAILSKSGGAHGIGFAVPSNMVRPILDQVKKHGRVRRGWLGVGIQDLTADLAASLEISGTEGVLITDVMDGGPAAKAKLQAGDVITSLNGKRLNSTAHLRNQVALLGPGRNAQLGILRDGKSLSVSVNLDEKEEKAEVAAKSSSESSLLGGLRLENLTPDLRRRLEAPPDLEGVLVTEVDPEGGAAAAGLRPGDVITRVDKKRVKQLSDLGASEFKGKKRVLLRVWRRGSFVFLVVRD